LTCTSPARIILWQADRIDAVLPKCPLAKTGCKMQDARQGSNFSSSRTEA